MRRLVAIHATGSNVRLSDISGALTASDAKSEAKASLRKGLKLTDDQFQGDESIKIYAGISPPSETVAPPKSPGTKVEDICPSQDNFLIAIVPGRSKNKRNELFPQGALAFELQPQANLEVGLEQTVSPVKEKESNVLERVSRLEQEFRGEREEMQQEREEMQQEREKMQQECEEMQQELGKVKGEHKEMQQKLGKMEGEHGKVKGELGKVKGELNETWQKLGMVEGELGKVKGELNDMAKSRENERTYTKKQEAALREIIEEKEKQQERERADYQEWIAAYNAENEGLQHDMQLLQADVYSLALKDKKALSFIKARNLLDRVQAQLATKFKLGRGTSYAFRTALGGANSSLNDRHAALLMLFKEHHDSLNEAEAKLPSQSQALDLIAERYSKIRYFGDVIAHGTFDTGLYKSASSLYPGFSALVDCIQSK
ncbi:hypothetical protein FA15DRAFT_752606 [Coprinopsis marcescibilis]|uniref:Uncharacterized protein n=1 Tax=Coprinopsis marcescibilis TaxID=230819 RepID=A0A5C3LBY3_COPMA|nr:hypothetical protein FA15DRAFT_752606 [Coprinopsis marcescibilis]